MDDTAVVHALELEASLVNETIWEVQANANTLNNLINFHSMIKKK